VRGPRPTLVLFWVGAVVLAVVLGGAILGLPEFGQTPHPYGQRAVDAALDQRTANAVASVTLDQRALDTLVEEFILFTAAVGTVLLLRRMDAEAEDRGERHAYGPQDVFDALRLVGYLLFPVTLLVGCYIVLHGHVSPGGGFQGGVVLATGVHLAYLAGDLRTLERLRPVSVFDVTEALGAAAYVVIGLAGLVAGSAFLANVLPLGALGDLLSAGHIPLLNIAVGIEVGSALVLLLAKFLEQALLVREPGEGD
jgi:multicomponent Na+:H+ antiporter subunit B